MPASYNVKNTAASVLVKTGPGGIHTVTLAAAADAATLIVYDNTSAAGTIICKLSAPLTGSASAVLDVTFGTGCYAAVTGTTPSATITFW
jgi:hypothetical protein